MSVAGVTRELLVRYLDRWLVDAWAGARRATVILAFDQGGAERAYGEVWGAAWQVVEKFAHQLGQRELTVIVIRPATSPMVMRVSDTPSAAGLTIHQLTGDVDALLPAAMTAAQAAGAPLLLFAHSDTLPPLKAVSRARPVDFMLAGRSASADSPTIWQDRRTALKAHGATLTCGVVLASDGPDRVVAFGTSSGKRLAGFKDAMWQVEHSAGVRYRDPNDPDAEPLAIDARAPIAGLQEAILGHLATGWQTVTELRDFALATTLHRAGDVTEALTELLDAKAVTRDPSDGRLGGDVVIALPR